MRADSVLTLFEWFGVSFVIFLKPTGLGFQLFVFGLGKPKTKPKPTVSH